MDVLLLIIYLCPIEGHLDCFQDSVITSKAAINIHVQQNCFLHVCVCINLFIGHILSFYQFLFSFALLFFPLHFNSSVGKESACNEGDPGLIPGLRRPPGEGISYALQYSWASLVAQLVKNPTCSAGDLGLIPGLGRSPGEGKGHPLQYSGLENSMDCIVHGVAKSRTQLSDFALFILTGVGFDSGYSD